MHLAVGHPVVTRVRAALVACLLACAAVAAAACGADSAGLSTDSTLTEEQANQRGAELIADAARQLSSSASLVEQPNQDVACTGLGGGEQLTVGKVAEVSGLDLARADSYVDQLRTYWTSKGYKEMDGSATYPLLRVEHPDDRFRLSFSVRNDVAELSAVLSCIWPDGTPPSR